jgi:ABC-type phosphate transport system substrate-binding protein
MTKPYHSLTFLWVMLIWLGLQLPCSADIIVIANPNVPDLDQKTLIRIYTGKVIELNGIHIEPFNLDQHQTTRAVFLQKVLNSTEESYISYWIVRQAIGKGVAPSEINTEQAIIDQVRKTPGGIGYIDGKEVPPEVKLLLRQN